MKWRAAVDRTVAPLGITHAQYSVLASLLGMDHRGYEPSQRELADHTGLDPLYVSKLARTLEGAGMMSRRADPDDSRAVRLSLTDAGRDVTRQAVQRVGRLQEQLTEPWGGRDSARTRRFIHDLQELLTVDIQKEDQP